MNDQQSTPAIARRGFLAGAAAATLIRPALVFGTQANSAVTLGLIGCGGRGSWITDFFVKSGKFQFTACADYFPDRASAVGNKHGIQQSRRFTGLAGYQRLLDAKTDAVVIETPPAFHPEHAAAAVDAGRHVFVAKPIAVDVPGCLTVAEAGKKATASRRVMLVDFQTRADPLFREAIGRVHRGEIGKLISVEAEYPWAGGGPGAPTPTPEARLRNWYQWLDLCGDVIVEQDIHALDVATWVIGADPVRAYGSCGRTVRVHGNISDHFSVIYWFPGDLVLTFSSVKCVPGVKDEIRCKAHGTEGMLDSDYFGEVWIRGKKPYPGGKTQNLYSSGTMANVEEFHRAITQGDYTNPTVAPSVRSNLTSVLGRTAAYEKRVVTWDELLKANVRVGPDVKGLTG